MSGQYRPHDPRDRDAVARAALVAEAHEPLPGGTVPSPSPHAGVDMNLSPAQQAQQANRGAGGRYAENPRSEPTYLRLGEAERAPAAVHAVGYQVEDDLRSKGKTFEDLSPDDVARMYGKHDPEGLHEVIEDRMPMLARGRRDELARGLAHASVARAYFSDCGSDRVDEALARDDQHQDDSTRLVLADVEAARTYDHEGGGVDLTQLASDNVDAWDDEAERLWARARAENDALAAGRSTTQKQEIA